MTSVRRERALWVLLAVVGTMSVAGAALAQDTGQEQAPLVQRSLFADRKAHASGDLLTVIVTESAAATATARTRADKEESVFGRIEHPEDRPWNIEFGFGNDFSGGGQIQRTGRLLAKLAVVVQDVDVNGNLSIVGEQDIFVNNERQRISLSGIVRPEDISPDNTVLSWRIADANIKFKGDGILARKQSPGLLTKLFDLFGLN